jgi:hypothetical protein
VRVPDDDPEVVDSPQVQELRDPLHTDVEHHAAPVEVACSVQFLLEMIPV